jgi:hypothetical protein
MVEHLDEEERWICPNCGEKMQRAPDKSAKIYVCPACGCSIEAGEENLALDNTCPNCNQLMDGNECPYCGYDLGSDFD